jgi:hypothetical protein
LGRKEIEPFDPFFVANSNNQALNSSSIEASTASSSEKIPVVVEKSINVSESEKIKQLNKSHEEEIERLKETVSTLEASRLLVHHIETTIRRYYLQIRNSLLVKQINEKKDNLQQQILDENVDSMSLEEIKQRYMKASHQSRQQLFTNQQLEGKLRNYHELVLQVCHTLL